MNIMHIVKPMKLNTIGKRIAWDLWRIMHSLKFREIVLDECKAGNLGKVGVRFGRYRNFSQRNDSSCGKRCH